MASFSAAYDRLLKVEGGYSNDPIDRGGETYRGIARNFWPDWEGWERVDICKGKPLFPKTLYIDEILSNMVMNFYKREFWDPLRGDEIANQSIAEELFDTAVNTGKKQAAIFLQQSLNVLNRRGARWPDIPEDGSIGSETLRTLEICLKAEHDMVDILLICMNGRQFHHYYSIVLSKPEQEKYMLGWIRHRVSLKGGHG